MSLKDQNEVTDYINSYFSETIGRIIVKFDGDIPWVGLTQVSLNGHSSEFLIFLMNFFANFWGEIFKNLLQNYLTNCFEDTPGQP